MICRYVIQEQQELMDRLNQEKLTAKPPTSVARSLFGRRF